MDPNQTLDEIRRLARAVAAGAVDADSRRLAGLVGELDAALSDGGQLPSDWDSRATRDEMTPSDEPGLERRDVLAFDEGLD
jgi:hypothetical protein